MQARFEKKHNSRFKKWKLKYWKLKGRRLIQYNSSVSSWDQCTEPKIKLEIDLGSGLTYSFYPKSKPKPNILQIKHPKFDDLLFRFNDSNKQEIDTMKSLLKVMTSFGYNYKKKQKYVAIPSNFSLAFWMILKAIYNHPKALISEGIFRKESTNYNVKHKLTNDLLFESISYDVLIEQYNDIYLLTKTLQHLLINLPSSIFGDREFEDLLDSMNDIDIDQKDNNNNNDNDDNVSSLSDVDLNELKCKINDIYLSSRKYQHRYGLLCLIFQLLKQITMNRQYNKMTAHSMSRLFLMCFESKNLNILQPFRALLLIKTLIYHAYYFFNYKQWKMKEIVIAEKQERITMEKYGDIQLSKKQLKMKLIKMGPQAPTRYYDQNDMINALKFINPNKTISFDSSDTDDDGDNDNNGGNKKKLGRYLSHDDMSLGNLQKQKSNVMLPSYMDIDANDNTSSPKHRHFEAYRRGSTELKLDNPLRAAPYRTRSNSVPRSFFNEFNSRTAIITSCNGWNTVNQLKIVKYSEPVYYWNNLHKSREYIFFVCNTKCWKYDVFNAQYTRCSICPNNIKLSNHSVSIDVVNQCIFVYGGNMVFLKINHITSRNSNINIICDGISSRNSNNLYNTGYHLASIYIGYNINELHIVGGQFSDYHLRWDTNKQKMIKLYNKFKFTNIIGHNLVYVHNEWNPGLESKLFLCGGYPKYNDQSQGCKYSNQILCCDIESRSSYKNTQWDELTSTMSSFVNDNVSTIIQLPIPLAYFGCINYKNLFLIIIGGKTEYHEINNNIWYLNLNQMKWKKSTIKCPLKSENGYYAILTNYKNIIHLFERNTSQHSYIKMSDVLSENEMNSAKKYQEKMYKSIASKSTMIIKQDPGDIAHLKQTSASASGSIISISEQSFLSNISNASSNNSNNTNNKNNKNQLQHSKYYEYDDKASHMSSSSAFSQTPQPTNYPQNNNNTTLDDDIVNDIYKPFDPKNKNKNKKKASPVPNFGDNNNNIKKKNANNIVDNVQHGYDTNEKSKSSSNSKSTSNSIQDHQYDIVKSQKRKKRKSSSAKAKAKAKKKKKKKRKNSFTSNSHHRGISREDIENDRFSCRVMYDWFYGMCGSGSAPPATGNRLPSNSINTEPRNSIHDQAHEFDNSIEMED